ncbi:MAG: response regulator transcription factor [Actinobacteria bacterium]|nr:response regulator transcription factor [Actinomycetota bacterium]
MSHGEPTAEDAIDHPVAAEPLRVMVVDDHDLFRSGLRRLLDAEPGLQVVADECRGDEAVKQAAELRPDVVVMDVRMPGMSGIDATRALLEASPDSGVLMLTISESENDVLNSVLAGALGYLVKDATLPQIVSAIHATSAGESIIAPRVAGVLLARLRRHGAAELEAPIAAQLSERELDVLRLLVRGSDTAEISKQLQLSPSTVKHHISSMLEKLGAENRIQAAVLAVRLGLVDEHRQPPA